MSLFDIRKQLVDETGRFDLVVNATAYVDAGANFHIRAGSRVLDSLQDNPHTYSTLVKDTAVDDFKLVFENNRSISKVWATDGSTTVGEGRSEIIKASRDFFKDNWKTPIANIDIERPTHYMPAIVNLAPEQSNLQPVLIADSPEILQNGNFDNPYFWTLSEAVNLSIHEGVLNVSAAAAHTVTSDDMRLIPGRLYQVVFTIATITAGSIIASLGGQAGSSRTTAATFTENIRAGTTSKVLLFTPSSDFAGTIDTVSIKEVITDAYTGVFTHDFEEYSLGDFHYGNTGILFLPPADKVYSISVEGRWWSRPLFNDSDENWWSFNHPDALVLATMLSLEKFRRNTQGVNDMRGAIREQLRGVDTDLSSMDIADVDFVGDEIVQRS